MTRAKKGPKRVYVLIEHGGFLRDAYRYMSDARDDAEDPHAFTFIETYQRVDPAAKKDREIANRCRDWVEDMGECLFCNYGDTDDAHQVFCPLYEAPKKGKKR